jgi:hypothetical protein
MRRNDAKASGIGGIPFSKRWGPLHFVAVNCSSWKASGPSRVTMPAGLWLYYLYLPKLVFEAKVTWHILNIYAFQFFPWILWLSEKLHIARGWKLEWLLIAASRRCALKAGMGNEWITLFWWKKPQCLALKHLLISITPKIARRFSLLLTHGVLFQLVYEERGGVVFRHRHMMAIVLRFKSPKWWITIKGYTTLSILLWW